MTHSRNYKLRILSCTNASFSVRDKGYQGKLVLHILQHNFDDEDLPFILANYEKYCAECRRVISQLLISHIETVIVEAYPLSFQLMMTIIDEKTFEPDRLFLLFSISVGGFDFPQAKKCLSCLGKTEYLSLLEGKHLKFAYTAANDRISDVFLQKD